jgi:hypothetical protein
VYGLAFVRNGRVFRRPPGAVLAMHERVMDNEIPAFANCVRERRLAEQSATRRATAFRNCSTDWQFHCLWGRVGEGTIGVQHKQCENRPPERALCYFYAARPNSRFAIRDDRNSQPLSGIRSTSRSRKAARNVGAWCLFRREGGALGTRDRLSSCCPATHQQIRKTVTCQISKPPFNRAMAASRLRHCCRRGMQETMAPDE